MALRIERKNYVLKTFSPGLIVANPALDPRFKEELDAKAAGKLREKHPDRTDINHSPYNFHEMSDWMTHDKKNIKDSVKQLDLCVDKLNEDGTPNTEGVIILDKVEDVMFLMIQLLSWGDTRPHLDTRFGKDLTDEQKQMVKDGHVTVSRETDDISKRKMPKE